MNGFPQANRRRVRELRALPDWTRSACGTTLTRRIGPAQVSLATDQEALFVLTVTVPLDAEDEADAAAVAMHLVECACCPDLACVDCGAPPIPDAD
jgi:hypothetical protein